MFSWYTLTSLSEVTSLFTLLQKSLDRVFSWHQGHSAPKHQPRSDEDEIKKVTSNEEETPEDTDADLLKIDVILVMLFYHYDL